MTAARVDAEALQAPLELDLSEAHSDSTVRARSPLASSAGIASSIA
jgi:hypothetical protein